MCSIVHSQPLSCSTGCLLASHSSDSRACSMAASVLLVLRQGCLIVVHRVPSAHAAPPGVILSQLQLFSCLAGGQPQAVIPSPAWEPASSQMHKSASKSESRCFGSFCICLSAAALRCTLSLWPESASLASQTRDSAANCKPYT